VETLSDDAAMDVGLPSSFYLPAGASANAANSAGLAERFLDLAARESAFALGAGDAVELDEGLHDYLRHALYSVGANRVTAPDSRPGPEATAAADDLAAITCQIELAAYNPGFWNNDATIRVRNNCYNYASNKRTDTFAQPGRGCGHQYTAITCAEMTRASLCDGLHHRFDCFPASEAPRYLVALVVAPGPGFKDFHWYRKLKEGFWAHKPGQTPVRNVDNSGHVITNPETCDRGPYTQFCGYFYTCKSQKIN
jgi:hypothetical protein